MQKEEMLEKLENMYKLNFGELSELNDKFTRMRENKYLSKKEFTMLCITDITATCERLATIVNCEYELGLIGILERDDKIHEIVKARCSIDIKY